MKQINIEGYAPEEILRLPDDQIEEMVFAGDPLVFRAGSAEILGEFKIRGESLVIELAQIDGGGEGVLPTLGSLARRGINIVNAPTTSFNKPLRETNYGAGDVLLRMICDLGRPCRTRHTILKEGFSHVS